jgi:hypothetical protein
MQDTFHGRARVPKWEDVRSADSATESRVCERATALIGRGNPNLQVHKQMPLPHRHASLGLHRTPVLEDHAAYAAAVATAQQDMESGASRIQPIAGPCWDRLTGAVGQPPHWQAMVCQALGDQHSCHVHNWGRTELLWLVCCSYLATGLATKRKGSQKSGPPASQCTNDSKQCPTDLGSAAKVKKALLMAMHDKKSTLSGFGLLVKHPEL